MIAIGCDPGLEGAIALVDRTGPLAWERLPTCPNGSGGTYRTQVAPLALRAILQHWSRRFDFAARGLPVVVVERMQAHRGTAAWTALVLGHSAGIVEAVLTEFAAEVYRPTAQQWKRLYALEGKKADSVACARRLWPDALPKVLAHDKAEAMLLARWGLIEYAGEIAQHIPASVQGATSPLEVTQ